MPSAKSNWTPISAQPTGAGKPGELPIHTQATTTTPDQSQGIWDVTGLEQSWQFLLVVVVQMGIGGHQVEQVLISGFMQLLGVLG